MDVESTKETHGHTTTTETSVHRHHQMYHFPHGAPTLAWLCSPRRLLYTLEVLDRGFDYGTLIELRSIARRLTQGPRTGKIPKEMRGLARRPHIRTAAGQASRAHVAAAVVILGVGTCKAARSSSTAAFCRACDALLMGAHRKNAQLKWLSKLRVLQWTRVWPGAISIDNDIIPRKQSGSSITSLYNGRRRKMLSTAENV